jgi:hypothetical protein
MKEDPAIDDKLKCIETAVSSMPPIVDGVMDHVRQMPTPVRPRFLRPQIVAVACAAAALCLAAAVGVWMVGGDREPISMASRGNRQPTSQYGESHPDAAARSPERGRQEGESSAEAQPPESVRGEGAVQGVRSGTVGTYHRQPVETVPVLPQWASPGGEQYARPLPSITVARSSAIAICTIVQMPKEGEEGFGVCEVERVIYGKLPEKRIRLYLSHARLGATRVFYLTAIPPEVEAEVDYRVHGSGPIDVGEVGELEQEVVEIVEKGDHLTPPDLSAYHLGMYVRASSRIVRAKLRKVGANEGEWKVLDELEFEPFSEDDAKGMRGARLEVADATAVQGLRGLEPAEGTAELRPSEPGIVRVGLATWRLRAETVAGYRAAHQPETALAMDGPEGGPVTGPEGAPEPGSRPTAKEIQQAFDRLVADELKPDTEAILLLRPAQEAETYDVVGNFFADTERPGHLDRAWKTIKRIVDSGKYKGASIHY